MENLFVYGTLNDKSIQKNIFGRELVGVKDVLSGYKIESIVIDGFEYPIIILSSIDDIIHGHVLSVTMEEILKADIYEGNKYKRITVILNSGINAWVYIKSCLP